MTLPKAALPLLLLATMGTAHTGTIEQAYILAQPLMQVKDGNIEGCGYRLVAFANGAENQKSKLIIDTSFNLYRGGLTLLKGGAAQVTRAQGNEVKSVTQPIESFWLKTQGNRATTPLGGKYVPAENKGYLLYGVTLEALVPLLRAVVEAEPLTIGVRLRGTGVDRIYTGPVDISKQDAEEGSKCFSELTQDMKPRIEGE